MKDEKQSDTLIFISETLKEANQIRQELIQQFSDIWLFVKKSDNGWWEISAANSFGGLLDKNKIELLTAFCQDMKKEMPIVPKGN